MRSTYSLLDERENLLQKRGSILARLATSPPNVETRDPTDQEAAPEDLRDTGEKLLEYAKNRKYEAERLVAVSQELVAKGQIALELAAPGDLELVTAATEDDYLLLGDALETLETSKELLVNIELHLAGICEPKQEAPLRKIALTREPHGLADGPGGTDFLSLPTQPEQTECDSPAWHGPHDSDTGAIVPVRSLVASSRNVAVILHEVIAYRKGGVLDVRLVARRAGMKKQRWEILKESIWSGPESAANVEDPSNLIRFGVRFPDGGVATTTTERHSDDEAPAVPYLFPHSEGSLRTTDDEEYEAYRYGLWLWPLPPAENFEFVAEWPLGDIPLTFHAVDGAAVTRAALDTHRIWLD